MAPLGREWKSLWILVWLIVLRPLQSAGLCSNFVGDITLRRYTTGFNPGNLIKSASISAPRTSISILSFEIGASATVATQYASCMSSWSSRLSVVSPMRWSPSMGLLIETWYTGSGPCPPRVSRTLTAHRSFLASSAVGNGIWVMAAISEVFPEPLSPMRRTQGFTAIVIALEMAGSFRRGRRALSNSFLSREYRKWSKGVRWLVRPSTGEIKYAGIFPCNHVTAIHKRRPTGRRTRTRLNTTMIK